MTTWKHLSRPLRLALAAPWLLALALAAAALEPAYQALLVNGTTHQPSADTPLNLDSANVTGPLDWAKLGVKPTTLTGYGITDAQPLDTDLTALAALTTTAWGRALLTVVDGAAARDYLGANDAANLSTGTLPDERLSANVPRLDGSQDMGLGGSLDVEGGIFLGGSGGAIEGFSGASFHDDGAGGWVFPGNTDLDGAGNANFGGSVFANAFSGDGSNLTGVTADSANSDISTFFGWGIEVPPTSLEEVISILNRRGFWGDGSGGSR